MTALTRHTLHLLAAALVAAATAMAAHAATDFDSLANTLTQKSLPVVNIAVDLDNVRSDTWTPCRVTIVDPQCRTNGERTLNLCAIVRYRGSSALFMAKKSLALKLVEDFDELPTAAQIDSLEDRDENVMDIRAENSWILDAMAGDRTRMHNRLLFDMWNDVTTTPYPTNYGNRNGTKGVYVELFFNSAYQGLYCLSDKIDRKLLNLKKAKNGAPRGVLYKCVGYDTATEGFNGYSDSLPTDTAVWGKWELKLPEEIPSEVAWAPLKRLIDLANDSSIVHFNSVVDDYIYIDNWVDYGVLVLGFALTDNVFKNVYLSIPDITKAQRATLTPWDLDACMGTNFKGVYSSTWYSATTFLTRNKLYKMLYDHNVQGFKQRLYERWMELSHGAWSLAEVERRMQEYCSQITDCGAWERERAKWTNHDNITLKTSLLNECTIALSYLTRNYSNLTKILKPARGDVNFDGIVSVADATAVYDTILAGSKFLYSHDTNGDGEITVADLTTIYDVMLGQ